MRWMRAAGMLILCAAACGGPLPADAADDPVFSGPQPGERLAALPVQLVLAADPSQTADVVDGGPQSRAQLVIFVHALTRPSVGFARTLGDYGASRKGDGLRTALVFLGEDPTQTAASVRRARHALPQNVTVGVSPDGVEGPGAWGLNRNVTLTVVLARDGVVTANFALIDPSIPAALPPILQAICKQIGGEPPSIQSLTAAAPETDRRPGR